MQRDVLGERTHFQKPFAHSCDPGIKYEQCYVIAFFITLLRSGFLVQNYAKHLQCIMNDKMRKDGRLYTDLVSIHRAHVKVVNAWICPSGCQNDYERMKVFIIY